MATPEEEKAAADAAKAAADKAAADKAIADKALADKAAADAVAKAKAGNRPGGGGGGENITVKAKEFMKRVRQTSEKEVQAALGCTLEEAKARLAAAAAGNAGAAGPAAVAANAGEDKKLVAEKARLEREVANLKAQNATGRSKDKDRIRELEDELQTNRVLQAARERGFADPDYAMFKFANAAAADATLEAGAFFDDLKTKQPALVAAPGAAPAPPPPRSVGASSAPPASPAPGGTLPNPATPNPAPSGSGSGEKAVDDMDAREFADHTERTYGYRPGR